MESRERQRAARVRAALRMSLVAIAVAACAAPPAKSPYARATQTRLEGVRGLCVMPLRSEVDDPPRVARFAAMLIVSLRGRGYEVVGATETTTALDRISREEAGTYDIYTGERLAGSDAILRRVRQRLGEELSCQAVVSPRIVRVVAFWLAEHGFFSEGTASWDGARVELDAGRGASGTIGALSLHVRITDLDDREVFYGIGGIRTTSIMVEEWAGTRFDPIEPTQLLADDDLNRSGIGRALVDLPRRSATSGSPPRP